MNVPTRNRVIIWSRNGSSVRAALSRDSSASARASNRRIVSSRASALPWLPATALNSRLPEPKCRNSSSVHPNAGSDHAPKGRSEGTDDWQLWLRRHDEYTEG